MDITQTATLRMKRGSAESMIAGPEDFDIVDFSGNGQQLFLFREGFLKKRAAVFDVIDLVHPAVAGGARPTSLLGLADCEALIWPQGFAPDGGVVFAVSLPNYNRSVRRTA